MSSGLCREGELTTSINRVSDGLRALRLLVAVGCVVSLTVSVLSYGAGGSSGSAPGHPWADRVELAQEALTVLAVVAVLWQRTRPAIALGTVVVVLCLTNQSTGLEAVLLLVSAVMVPATAGRRSIAVLVIAQSAFCLAFAFVAERSDPGRGWWGALLVFAVCGSGWLVGSVTRPLLSSRDARRQQVAELAAENRLIRHRERHRLADDLQRVVVDGLDEIENVLASDGHDRDDRAAICARLARVEVGARAVLDRLRALLEVLRVEPELWVASPGPGLAGSAPTAARPAPASPSRGSPPVRS